jgi:translation initiation factor IF-3
VREVRFKPKIGAHDIDFKTKVIVKLLNEGDKVKVSVMFRGREITHPEIGRGLLMRVQENLKDLVVVERQPIMEGRFMNMYLAPLPQSRWRREVPIAEAPRATGSDDDRRRDDHEAALKAASMAPRLKPPARTAARRGR